MARANKMVRSAWRLGRLGQAHGALSSRLRDLALRAAPASTARRGIVSTMLDGFTVEPSR
jgi:hypothetical protein